MFNGNRSSAHRSLVAFIIIFIIGAAVAGAWYDYRSADHVIRQQLEDRSETIALLLDQTDLKQLTGKESDTSALYYQRLKKTLSSLKAANPDIRSLYYTVAKDDKLYFYVDSEKPDSPVYSPPGEFYPDASDEFKAIFVNGKGINEGPSKDDYGTWVSGLAPVRDSFSGQVLGVLGIDIDASYYYSAVVSAGAVPVLLGLILLGIVLAYEWLRLREARTLRLQSELVSIASHELRSPLAGVRWSVERLLHKLKGDDHEIARGIFMSVNNLQAGVDDIMQITRQSSRKNRKLEYSDCDMTALLATICNTQKLSAEQRGVMLNIDESWHPSDTGAVRIHCDADRMKRALHNVISNAVKYTRDNTEVTVTYRQTDKFHEIIVADQGIGIPANEKDKVFGGFYRASNAKSSGIEGTGLGLYLTKSVIEQHKGTVTCESIQDKGTTFVLSIPH